MAKDPLLTRLAALMSSSATTATVLDGSQLPSANFRLRLDGEEVFVAARSGTSLSGIKRGQGYPATTATSHEAGTAVYWVEDTVDVFNVVDYGAVGSGSGNYTDQMQDCIDDAAPVGGTIVIPTGTFMATALTVDLSAGATTLGERAPHIVGVGRKSTIKQVAASTGDILSIIGNGDGTSHAGKATGVLVSDLDIEGVSTGGHGIRMLSYSTASLKRVWTHGCGDSGIMLDRTVFTAGVAEHYAYLFTIEDCKSILNGRYGIEGSATLAIGNGVISATGCESNTLGGIDIIPSALQVSGCHIGSNDGPGINLRRSATSTTGGCSIVDTRLEGNDTNEIVADGQLSLHISNPYILASAGATLINIGNGSNPCRDTVISGGLYMGDGATAGQKVFNFGAQATRSIVMDARIETSTFQGASTDYMSYFTINAAADLQVIRGTTFQRQNTYESQASGDVMLNFRDKANAAARFRVKSNGILEWGDGTAAVNTNLYRIADNQLHTDDKFSFGATTAFQGVFTHAITGTKTWTWPDASGTPAVITNSDALGGGATATMGTIGGSGPAAAAQSSWQRIRLIDGSTAWVPVWL